MSPIGLQAVAVACEQTLDPADQVVDLPSLEIEVS
jgi:hypothetical protein